MLVLYEVLNSIEFKISALILTPIIIMGLANVTKLRRKETKYLILDFILVFNTL